MINALCAIVVVLIHCLCYPETPWKILSVIFGSLNSCIQVAFRMEQMILVWADCSVVERPVLSLPHLVMTLTVIISALVPTLTRFDCKSRWSCFWSFAQSILELIGVNERVRSGFWNSSVSMTICKNPLLSQRGLAKRVPDQKIHQTLTSRVTGFLRSSQVTCTERACVHVIITGMVLSSFYSGKAERFRKNWCGSLF